VAFVTVLVLGGCTGAPTTTALAVRVSSVGVLFPGNVPATARDIAKVAGATACKSWVPQALLVGGTDLVVKVLVSTSDVAKVRADLSQLHDVRSVAEIARSQFDKSPPPDPGPFVPDTCG
jgi:hypothetical protein